MSRGILEENAASADELREIAIGRRGGRVSRVRAVVALARARVPGSDQLLATVLGDETAPVPVRAGAAAGLGHIGTTTAISALTVAAGSREPAVAAAVITALSRVGDEGAMDRLIEVQRRTTGPLRSLSAFAASLIAYRLGLEGQEIEAPRDDAFVDIPQEAPRIELTQASDEEARSCVGALSDEPFDGVQYAERPVHRLTCDRGSWFLVVNQAVVDPEALTLLTRRKLVFGVLARRYADRSTYAAGCYILTAPAGSSGLHVFVPTTVGQLYWAGSGNLDGTAARARIRALARAGALPIDLDVRFEGGQLELVSGTFDHSIHTGREPTLSS